VTPEARTVQALFDAQPFLLSGEYYFWDPLSAALLVESDLARYERRTVTVLEGEKETQGQIVDDAAGVAIRIATEPDALAFERAFLNTLNEDEQARSTRPDPVARIEIGDRGCAYLGPTSLPAELVALELGNTTGERWTAILASIAEGHTYEELVAFVRTFDPEQAPPSWIVGASFTEAPPETNQLVAWPLEPGIYGLVCTTGQTARELQVVTEIVAG
jgi:hypothetical protein